MERRDPDLTGGGFGSDDSQGLILRAAWEEFLASFATVLSSGSQGRSSHDLDTLIHSTYSALTRIAEHTRGEILLEYDVTPEGRTRVVVTVPGMGREPLADFLGDIVSPGQLIPLFGTFKFFGIEGLLIATSISREAFATLIRSIVSFSPPSQGMTGEGHDLGWIPISGGHKGYIIVQRRHIRELKGEYAYRAKLMGGILIHRLLVAVQVALRAGQSPRDPILAICKVHGRILEDPDVLIDVLLALGSQAGRLSQSKVDPSAIVIAGLPASLLAEAIHTASKRLSKTTSGSISTHGSRKREVATLALLKRFSRALAGRDDRRYDDLLLKLVRMRVMGAEKLPSTVRLKQQAERLVNEFLTNPKDYLRRFDGGPMDQYRTTVGLMVRLIIELVRRGKVGPAASIARLGNLHKDEQVKYTAQLEVFSQLEIDDALALIKEQLVKQDKESHPPLFEIVSFFGDLGAAFLVDLLRSEPNVAVRKEICVTLESMGDEAEEVLSEALKAKGQDWFVYRNIINVVGDLKVSEGEELTRFFRHPHERVREAAFEAAFKIRGPSIELSLIDALDDKAVVVIRMALLLLGKANSRHPRFVETLVHAIRKCDYDEEELPDEIQIGALRALENLGNVILGQVGIAQELLMDAIQRKDKFRVGRLIKPGRKAKSDKVRAAMCDTLAEIGRKEVMKVLSELCEDQSPTVARRALAAYHRLESRLLMGK